MFLLFLIIMIIGFVINNIGYAGFARKYDGILLSLYRSTSISIFLLPLLYYTDLTSLSALNLFIFFFLGFIGAIGIVFQIKAYKYLPVGIVSSLMNLNVILVIIFGYLFYNETLDLYGYIGGTLVIASSVLLGLIKSDFTHLDKNYSKGIILVTLRILTLGIWVFGVAYLGREVDIYTSAFMGEATCIFTLVLMLLYGKIVRNNKIKPFLKKDIIKILFISFLPALGTFAMVKSFTLGSIGIVSISLASISIFTAIVASFVYNEKLSYKQRLLIIVTLLGLGIMNINSI